jgi:hypothetical protein
MRIFGLVGLVLALLIVGVLVKKQVGGMAAPASAAPGSAAPSTPAQGRQLEQDIKKSLDAALQQRRPVPDESP